VPLSEHEQRLLEQIEQALYAEDPKFAQSWRARADIRRLQRTRVIRGAVVITVGLALLLAGVILQGSNTVVGVILGVAGFLLMLGGAWLAMSGRQRPAARATAVAKARGPRQSIIERLNERWERRRETGNF
jgi:predicted cobalt transporter CbtA